MPLGPALASRRLQRRVRDAAGRGCSVDRVPVLLHECAAPTTTARDDRDRSDWRIHILVYSLYHVDFQYEYGWIHE
eukprot:COSAG06_NODE_67699_length_251_cov_0.677632_1_plen_76_part_10